MTPTRAPSLDLLRALRHTANPLLRTSHTSRACTLQRHHQHNLPPTPSHTLRPFSTTLQTHLTRTSSLHDSSSSSSSQPKPSTNPPTTSASPSGTTTTVAAAAGSPATPNKHNPYAPTTHDRGPTSKEDTQTDFGMMDIYANIAAPATSIDACTSDGFHLDNGIKIGGFAGLLVAGGEAWTWRPWLALQGQNTGDASSSSSASKIAQGVSPISALLDARRGILTIPKQSLGLFAMLHPKPDLLIIGTGSKLWMLAPETKRYFMEELGMRVDVMDTGNASAAYNLLAKERGVEGGAGVGGAFLPIGWKGPELRTRKR